MQMRGATSSILYKGVRASQHAQFELEQTTTSDGSTSSDEQQERASASSRKSSRDSMAQVHSKVSMVYRQSKVSIALMQAEAKRAEVSKAPKYSKSSRRSTTFNLPRASLLTPSGRSSKVGQSVDLEAIFSQMSAFHGPPRQDGASRIKTLSKYFMGFWKAPNVAAALARLERLETKRTVRDLQKRHGFWQPPPEVAEALKKTLPTPASNFPDNKDSRNLKFVLNVLGCPLQDNKPYKRFQKAKTLRQKRNWLYKYQGPTAATRQNPTYIEPVSPTRLKRLYQFFPDRFTEEDGYMYFNNKMLTYDETKKVFYIGKELLMDE